jgi:hypothetical protein
LIGVVGEEAAIGGELKAVGVSGGVGEVGVEADRGGWAGTAEVDVEELELSR